MHVILCISNEFLPVDSAKYQLEFRQVSVVRLNISLTDFKYAESSYPLHLEIND